MAGGVLMPLHDNPDSGKLVEWMNEVPHYGINDQKPFDWTPFQGCDYCNGLCSVLESADSVRQLLDGQSVLVFQGQYEDLEDIAKRGCEFASYLIFLLEYYYGTDHGLDMPIDFAIRRIDATGPSSVRLVSIVEGERFESVQPLYLAVATAPNNPADTITSRLPDVDPISRQSLMLLKVWLADCASGQHGHTKCSDMMPVRTELPTRVVYVGTDDGNDPPRLYSSNGEIAGYVALSYCWGGSQRHQTERSRIERYMHALPLEGLPKSLQDAILLTRALGIQYIWIDSLCIIQDCDEDKHREMARMANIYKNTIFTISAARAKSCHEGFLGVQDKRALLLQKSIQLPMNCLNGAIGSVLLYPTRTQFGREHTPIDKRAWTYQEQVLSRRLISFFDNAVEWTCPSCHLSDDGLGTDETNVTNPAYQKTLAPLSGRSSFVSRGLYLVSKWRYKLLEARATLPPFWWAAVQEFALGSLSNLDDRLPAIAGIASEFHDLTGDVYVAGLWRSHLIKGLQWVVWEQLEEPSDNTGNKDIKYNAPTWTWASVHGYEIWALTKSYDLDSKRVEVIDCNVNLVSLSAPFGSVNGGELKIRAPLKCLSYRQIEETMIMYHSVEDRDGGGFIRRIFFDRRSWRHADELNTLRGGAAPHIESTEIWFLGLSKHADLSYEFSGLALAKRADGLFERVGHFQIYVGDEWHRHGTAEKDEFRASWGNSYVVTTVTIV